jgi:hypothetical protein
MARNDGSETAELILDALPDHVEATMQVRDSWLKRLPRSSQGLEFVVSDLQRWQPGTSVRIAFLSGPSPLHRDIAQAVSEITEHCNLKLDFGFDNNSGAFRAWRESDTQYSADIRVSFDQSGFFSLVGTDSINGCIGAPEQKVGGRPCQRSLNLGGFVVQRPSNWQGVVRHEFLHALAFQHAHQNARGPCEAEFRWEDDDGYEPTTDARGAYGKDAAGRSPGIYTYLAGPPNYWSRTKVDHNLRRIEGAEVTLGAFDRSSIMLYRFPDHFYKKTPSDCAPLSDGISLSEGDKRGLRLLYPQVGPQLVEVVDHRNQLLGKIDDAVDEGMGLETTRRSVSPLNGQAAAALRSAIRR